MFKLIEKKNKKKYIFYANVKEKEYALVYKKKHTKI